EDLATPVTVATTLLKGPDRIGTDPWMACNAYANSARTGSMILTPKGYFVLPGEKPVFLGPTAPEFDMLATAVTGSIVGYAARYKELVVVTHLAKDMFSRGASPHINLKPQIKLSNLVPEIAPATIDPDKIAQL